MKYPFVQNKSGGKTDVYCSDTLKQRKCLGGIHSGPSRPSPLSLIPLLPFPPLRFLSFPPPPNSFHLYVSFSSLLLPSFLSALFPSLPYMSFLLPPTPSFPTPCNLFLPFPLLPCSFLPPPSLTAFLVPLVLHKPGRGDGEVGGGGDHVER